MSVIEQEIYDRVHQLSDQQKQLVLEYVRQLVDMAEVVSKVSARDLMKLPQDERRRILAASLTLAEEEDFELFEAYREEPIDGSD